MSWKRYTFAGSVWLEYERKDEQHRFRDKDGESLFASVSLPLSYEIHGRYFIAQAYSELIPTVFELLPAKEYMLEINEEQTREKL